MDTGAALGALAGAAAGSPARVPECQRHEGRDRDEEPSVPGDDARRRSTVIGGALAWFLTRDSKPKSPAAAFTWGEPTAGVIGASETPDGSGAGVWDGVGGDRSRKGRPGARDADRFVERSRRARSALLHLLRHERDEHPVHLLGLLDRAHVSRAGRATRAARRGSSRRARLALRGRRRRSSRPQTTQGVGHATPRSFGVTS